MLVFVYDNNLDTHKNETKTNLTTRHGVFSIDPAMIAAATDSAKRTQNLLKFPHPLGSFEICLFGPDFYSSEFNEIMSAQT